MLHEQEAIDLSQSAEWPAEDKKCVPRIIDIRHGTMLELGLPSGRKFS